MKSSDKQFIFLVNYLYKKVFEFFSKNRRHKMNLKFINLITYYIINIIIFK